MFTTPHYAPPVAQNGRERTVAQNGRDRSIRRDRSSSLLSHIEDRLRFLQHNKYWPSVVSVCKFVLHFVVVMVILYCGALVFAHLEGEVEEEESLGSLGKVAFSASLSSVWRGKPVLLLILVCLSRFGFGSQTTN